MSTSFSFSARVDQPFTAIPTPNRTRKPSSALDSPAGRKLRKAAAEFEAQLLSTLWKSMKSTFAAPDDDSDDPAHETLEDMGIQAMSNAVGKAGGLGLGKLIVKHLEPLLPHSHIGDSSNNAGKAWALPADTFHVSR